jgi:hypothetical protein
MRVLKVIEVVWSVDREPHAFCSRWCTCKKYKRLLGTSIKSSWLIYTWHCAYKRWLGTSIESPCLICTRRCVCKKWLGMSIRSPWFLRVSTLTVRAIGSKPLASIGNAYCYLGKDSQIIMMRRNAYRLTRLQGSRFESWPIVDWSNHKT